MTPSCYDGMDRYSDRRYMDNECMEQPIRDVKLAHAYVPFQKFCCIMCPMESLAKGTAFPDLWSPYCKREFVNIEPEVMPGRGGRYCYE